MRLRGNFSSTCMEKYWAQCIEPIWPASRISRPIYVVLNTDQQFARVSKAIAERINETFQGSFRGPSTSLANAETKSKIAELEARLADLEATKAPAAAAAPAASAPAASGMSNPPAIRTVRWNATTA